MVGKVAGNDVSAGERQVAGHWRANLEERGIATAGLLGGPQAESGATVERYGARGFASERAQIERGDTVRVDQSCRGRQSSLRVCSGTAANDLEPIPRQQRQLTVEVADSPLSGSVKSTAEEIQRALVAGVRQRAKKGRTDTLGAAEKRLEMEVSRAGYFGRASHYAAEKFPRTQLALLGGCAEVDEIGSADCLHDPIGVGVNCRIQTRQVISVPSMLYQACGERVQTHQHRELPPNRQRARCRSDIDDRDLDGGRVDVPRRWLRRYSQCRAVPPRRWLPLLPRSARPRRQQTGRSWPHP